MKIDSCRNCDESCKCSNNVKLETYANNDFSQRKKSIQEEKKKNPIVDSVSDYLKHQRSTPRSFQRHSSNKQFFPKKKLTIKKLRSKSISEPALTSKEKRSFDSNSSNEMPSESQWNNIFNVLRHARPNDYSSSSPKNIKSHDAVSDDNSSTCLMSEEELSMKARRRPSAEQFLDNCKEIMSSISPKHMGPNDIVSDNDSPISFMPGESSSTKERRRPSADRFLNSCKKVMSSVSKFIKLDKDDDQEQHIKRLKKYENSDFYPMFENDDRFWIENDGWITLPDERRKLNYDDYDHQIKHSNYLKSY